MASTIRAGFPDVGNVKRDLESVKLGLGRAVNEAIKRDAQPIVAETIRLTPHGPGPQSPKDNLPHVAQTIRVAPTITGFSIIADHPAAGWLEFGGTIRPHRYQPITIRGYAMAHRAGENRVDAVARDITQSIDALLRQHGL